MSQTDLPAYKAVVSDEDAQFGSWSPFVTPTGSEPPPPPPPPPGEPNAPGDLLALLVTEGEVAMWRDRAANGPYRTVGDVAPNSPGHWLEMVESSRLDFTSWRWSGPTNISGGKVVQDTNGSNDPPKEVKFGSLSLMDAAYVAVVNDDTALAQSVVDEIAWYSTQPNLDFNDRTLYPFDYYFDGNPLFVYAELVLQLAQAYDAATILATPNSTVEAWFAGLAELCNNSLRSFDNELPNRRDDDYTSRASFIDSSVNGSTRLADGSIVYHPVFGKYYNNRRNQMAGLMGFSGLLTGTTTDVDWAKRYMREWMMFSNRTTPDQETFADHNRGSNSYPQKGFGYDIGSSVAYMPFLEALARSGDTSVYDFASGVGADIPTWGTNHYKTMKQVLGQRIGWIAGTNTAHYTGSGDPPSSAVAGDSYYQIKSRRSGSNEIVFDGWLIAAAAYYNEPGWEDVVNRKGTPTGFTSTPVNAGNVTGWRVDHRARFLRSLDANPHGG